VLRPSNKDPAYAQCLTQRSLATCNALRAGANAAGKAAADEWLSRQPPLDPTFAQFVRADMMRGSDAPAPSNTYVYRAPSSYTIAPIGGGAYSVTGY
jgi:hypothetical protein